MEITSLGILPSQQHIIFNAPFSQIADGIIALFFTANMGTTIKCKPSALLWVQSEAANSGRMPHSQRTETGWQLLRTSMDPYMCMEGEKSYKYTTNFEAYACSAYLDCKAYVGSFSVLRFLLCHHLASDLASCIGAQDELLFQNDRGCCRKRCLPGERRV